MSPAAYIPVITTSVAVPVAYLIWMWQDAQKRKETIFYCECVNSSKVLNDFSGLSNLLMKIEQRIQGGNISKESINDLEKVCEFIRGRLYQISDYNTRCLENFCAQKI